MARETNGKVTNLSAQAEVMGWDRPPSPGDPEATGNFAPGKAPLPIRPEEEPRIFQYQPGVNLVTIPRAGFGMAPFAMLRNLAAACKEIRLNIELIKREIRAMEWEIVSVKEDDKKADIDDAKQFLQQPDGYHDFDGWVNMLLEEMMVTDSVTIWPEHTLGGEMQQLELVDGTTIRPLLDFRGRVARPPAPAYMQILHGLPSSYFAGDQLLYRPFNTSVNSPYGTSPIEFILMTVNLALRRDVYHVGYFTEGNVPEALVGAPATWTQPQVETWQNYWDSMVQGNIAQQRKMHFVPLEGRSNIPVYEFKKDNVDTTTQDEWLMRVACWAFGNSPAEFGLTPNAGLGGKGFSEGQENIQYRSMTRPIAQYIERLLTSVIQEQLCRPGLKFKWVGLEPEDNKLQQAQVDQIYINAGVYTPEHVAERLGVEAPPENDNDPNPPTGNDNNDEENDPDADEEAGVTKFFRYP